MFPRSVKRKMVNKQKCIQKIKEGHSITITGQAGTGKTYMIKQAYNELSKDKKRVKILCSTGIACLQYESAQTVHSWAGLMDGRFDDATLKRLVKDDDCMDHVRRNVSCVDVLLIDEMSMLSKKDFEQLELVCRTLLDDKRNFGGLQVIATGDFYQLPPVANPLSGDFGQFCFESHIWKSFFSHSINLTEVVRQTEPELITAVRETARGEVSNETDLLLKSLERDLVGETDRNPIHLFAKNFDVNVFNHHNLDKLNSDCKTFQAKSNKGPQKYLRRILAPNFLKVKENCPVILLRNLGGMLVNGLRGKVTKFTDDYIKVRFELINEVYTIKRSVFTVYNVVGDIVAERIQFPLCLAYGLTIHKSQGMTLNSVTIHCKGIFESGQLSVAIGRATNTAGIQLIDYRKSLCFKPKEIIVDFYETKSNDFEDSLICCMKSPNVCIPDSDFDFQMYDTDDSDFNDSEIEDLEKVYDSDEQFTNVLPVYVSINMIKQSVIVKSPQTDRQIDINSICQSVSDEKLQYFLYKNHANLKMFMPCSEIKTTPKLWTDILGKYFLFTNSFEYKETVKSLYGESDCLSKDNKVYVATQFLYKLFNLMVNSLASEVSNITEDSEENSSDRKTPMTSEAGKAKIRYVAGMCVAKARQNYCTRVQNQLGRDEKSGKETLKNNLAKVTLITSLQAERDEIDTADKSFSEIELRQNSRKGLTYVNDECFQFFLNLDDKIQKILNADKFKSEKDQLFEKAQNALLKDQDLLLLWDELSMNVTSDGATLYSVYENLVSRYLMVSEKQFLKDMKDMLHLKRKKAHREEIKKKGGKRKADISISYKGIQDDKSDNKINSHLKIKCNIISNEHYLTDSEFTKQQLLILCEAYNVKCVKNNKKSVVAESLQKVIKQVNNMPNSDSINTSASATGKEATSSKIQGRAAKKRLAYENEA